MKAHDASFFVTFDLADEQTCAQTHAIPCKRRIEMKTAKKKFPYTFDLNVSRLDFYEFPNAIDMVFFSLSRQSLFTFKFMLIADLSSQ